MIRYISPASRAATSPLPESIQPASLADLLAWIPQQLLVQLDSETTGFDPHTCKLLTIQFGDAAGTVQWVLDVQEGVPPELVTLLNEDARTYLLQNAKFDLKFLLHRGINLLHVLDTFLAETILTNGLRETQKNREEHRLGLDFLAEKYLGVTLDKSIRGNIHREGLTPRVITYAADDVKCLGGILLAQLDVLEREELLAVFELECDVVRVFARMEYQGVPFNPAKWNEVAELVSRQVLEREGELNELVLSDTKLTKYHPTGIQQNLFEQAVAKPTLNWKSNDDKLALLRQVLDDPTIPTCDKEVLHQRKHQHPLVSKLLEFNTQVKLNDAYGKKFLDNQHKKTGRLHTDIKQIINSGRISTKKPNLNVMPSKGPLAKPIRAAFEAPAGYQFVGGDWGQIELRILAEYAPEPVWIQAFQEGKDLMTVLCPATFGITEAQARDPFPPNPGWTYRDVQKTVSYGSVYGAGAQKIASTIQIPKVQAQGVLDAFFAGAPNVAKLLKRANQIGRSRGYIKSAPPFNRKRYFDLDLDHLSWEDQRQRLSEIERESANHIAQATCADALKVALVTIQQEIDLHYPGVQIVLAVYDEIQTICPDELVPAWKVRLEELMIQAGQVVLKTVPVTAEVKSNTHWTK